MGREAVGTVFKASEIPLGKNMRWKRLHRISAGGSHNDATAGVNSLHRGACSIERTEGAKKGESHKAANSSSFLIFQRPHVSEFLNIAITSSVREAA